MFFVTLPRYAPCALFAFFYVLVLARVGAVTDRDFHSGACATAIASTPIVFTLLLAATVPPPEAQQNKTPI